MHQTNRRGSFTHEPQSAVLADHGGRFVHAAADEHNGQLAIGGEDIRPAAKHGHAPPDPIRRLGQRFQIRGAFKRGECQRPAPQVQGGQRSHARRRNDPYHRFSSFPFVSQENDSVEYYFLQGAKPVHLIKGHLSGHAPPFAPQAFTAERGLRRQGADCPLTPSGGRAPPGPRQYRKRRCVPGFCQSTPPVPYNGTPVAQPPHQSTFLRVGVRGRTLFTKSALPRFIPKSILAHRAGYRPLRLRPKRSPIKDVIHVAGYRTGRRTAAAPVLQHDDNDHILSVLAAV